MPKINKVYVWRQTAKLPSEYKEVEYIQSTATNMGTYSSTGQLIDTGYTHTPNTKIEIDYQFTNTTVQSRLFGVQTESSSYSTISAYINGSSKWARAFKDSTGDRTTTNVAVDTNRHTFILDKGSYKIYTNGSQIYSGTNPNTPTKNGYHTLPLFCAYENSSSASNKYVQHASAKLYACKIWDNNVLVRDFIPCYRKSDNVIGLYDLVNNQFYTNAGTGNFTKGDDVQTYKEFLVRSKKNDDVYYSDNNWEEYQSLVNSVGSVNFVDTGKRYRFGGSCCYIGDRIALNVSGTSWNKVNLDTLTVVSTKTLGNSIGGKFWYLGDNRILTRRGILDFDGNFITTFSYTFNSITLGLPGVVWANVNYDIYKGIVNGDNVTFTKVGTGSSDQSVGGMHYGRLGAYLINYNDNSGNGYSSYVNPSTNAISNFTGGSSSRQDLAVSGADGKLYRWACRDNGWGKLQKIGTGNEGFVGSSLSSSWSMYGRRIGKFLGNIVSGGMNRSNSTGNGYGSNNYFINTSGTLTLAQSNALAYDSNIYTHFGFIDENGWIYPHTDGGGSGVILKTNKTFTNFNWKNPYLWR